MLRKVEVHSEQGILELNLLTKAGGYVVEDVAGLGPNKASISYSSTAMLDGKTFQAARGDLRNVVIKLGISAMHLASSVAARRANLYAHLMPKSKVMLRFFTDEYPVVDLEGWVETLDSPLFVQDPKATISILCLETTNFVTSSALTFDGTSSPTGVGQALDYVGSIRTGFNFVMTVQNEIEEFELSRVGEPGVEFYGQLLPGDRVEISTIGGSKYAQRVRAGVRTSIMHEINPASDWFALKPGINNVALLLPGETEGYRITYNALFGGL